MVVIVALALVFDSLFGFDPKLTSLIGILLTGAYFREAESQTRKKETIWLSIYQSTWKRFLYGGILVLVMIIFFGPVYFLAKNSGAVFVIVLFFVPIILAALFNSILFAYRKIKNRNPSPDQQV
jgi:hypothetical protein